MTQQAVEASGVRSDLKYKWLVEGDVERWSTETIAEGSAGSPHAARAAAFEVVCGFDPGISLVVTYDQVDDSFEEIVVAPDEAAYWLYANRDVRG